MEFVIWPVVSSRNWKIRGHGVLLDVDVAQPSFVLILATRELSRGSPLRRSITRPYPDVAAKIETYPLSPLSRDVPFIRNKPGTEDFSNTLARWATAVPSG
jgi:hypothetical protein